MGQTSNSLNCLEIVLDVTPIEDISGIGVAIGCISTAGIVIVINIVYYVLAFQHDLDPFQRTSRTASSSSALDNPASSSPGAFGTAKDQRWSNPVDELVYNCFLRLIRKKVGVLREDRFNKIMMKCLLCMSDLQIVTGLSILISGYASLSEVAIYHWNVFVYLAWFSSLTQFCSITFLRNYLYNHSGQRLWRMMSMVIIVVMLGVAIYPTGSFERISSSPGTPAQCYFGKKSDKDSFAFQAMVISIFSICLACVAHIVRLYKPLSTLLVRYRRYVSKYARSILLRIYKWPQDTRSLKRTFIYHFCLSIFLVLRAALDIYTSMFMEIWWLLIGFTWGIIQLVKARQIADGGGSDWTFGQITPLILLCAPIVTVIEYVFDEGEESTHTEDQEKLRNKRRSKELFDDPDNPFYDQIWFKRVILYIILSTIGISIETMIISGLESTTLFQHIFTLTPHNFTFSFWTLFTVPLSFIMYTMYAIFMENIQQQGIKLGTHTVYLLTFILLSYFFAEVFVIGIYSLILLVASFVLYVVLCLVSRCFYAFHDIGRSHHTRQGAV